MKQVILRYFCTNLCDWSTTDFEIVQDLKFLALRSRNRSGVAKNIGAPIMPRPFQLFRCPFRSEMSTCGFGEVRQTIRKYFKIPPLAIKCRSSAKSRDLWDPGVMSVDIDSLLLFRRQTAKTNCETIIEILLLLFYKVKWFQISMKKEMGPHLRYQTIEKKLPQSWTRTFNFKDNNKMLK